MCVCLCARPQAGAFLSVCPALPGHSFLPPPVRPPYCLLFSSSHPLPSPAPRPCLGPLWKEAPAPSISSCSSSDSFFRSSSRGQPPLRPAPCPRPFLPSPWGLDECGPRASASVGLNSLHWAGYRASMAERGPGLLPLQTHGHCTLSGWEQAQARPAEGSFVQFL